MTMKLFTGIIQSSIGGPVDPILTHDVWINPAHVAYIAAIRDKRYKGTAIVFGAGREDSFIWVREDAPEVARRLSCE